MSENLQALMREILEDNCKAALNTMTPSKKKIIELTGNRNHIINLQNKIEIDRRNTLKTALYHGMAGLGISLVLWAALFISMIILHNENIDTIHHLFAFSVFIAFSNVYWNARIMSRHSTLNYPDGYTPIK